MKGRKICEYGLNCPWKTEYQHSLEYTHILKEDNPKKSEYLGKGHKLGSEPIKLPRTSESKYGDFKIKNKQEVIFIGDDDDDYIINNNISKSENKGINLNGKKRPRDNEHDFNEFLQCQICNSMISLNNFDKHMTIHEKHGDELKKNQDDEYFKAIEETIINESKKIAEQKRIEEEELNRKENEELQTLLEQSRKSTLESNNLNYILNDYIFILYVKKSIYR